MDRDALQAWMKANRVSEVSCLVPDMSGTARGKSMAPSLFLDGLSNQSLRIPEAAYTINVQGDTTFNQHVDQVERDLILQPDLSTTHLVPWNKDASACLICDCVDNESVPSPLAPRQILRRVVELYANQGWKPIVGPEVEFYLIDVGKGANLSPTVPLGASGQREYGQHLYSLDALDEFDDLFEELYSFSELQNIKLDTLIHEDGPCQFEVSLRHSDALQIADQLFLFKRMARQVAKRHDVFMTFMAKPYPDQSGSAIHLHQSVVDSSTGKNIFSDKSAEDTPAFLHFIGGLQKYLPEAMLMQAPYTNSYNRFEAYVSAPTNTHWSRENRTVGLRVPQSSGSARRVENRIPGADINPYLSIAASLVCGFAGMIEEIDPRPEWLGQGYESGNGARELPATLNEAVSGFLSSEMLRKYLGDPFVETYAHIKRAEYDHRSGVLSPWDIQYLLTNV